MRCTSPRTVGFAADGKTICWSSKKYSKEFATFQLPCGKCISCRLQYARSWAIRCVHEASMYEKNSFITLTYSNENLKSPKLIYEDFQKFVKKVRKRPYFRPDGTWVHESADPEPLGYIVAGEYGEQTKRPHWHTIMFNYEPRDRVLKYTTERGDQVYTSNELDRLWGHGHAEFGSVTLESAGYCARYSAKKLVHGKDEDHDFKPIFKVSSKQAIGKRWLEKYWADVFQAGRITIDGKIIGNIPRYYEKWLKEHKPNDWLAYVTRLKLDRMANATDVAQAENLRWLDENHERRNLGKSQSRTLLETEEIIIEEKFKQLQDKLKL